VTADGETAEDLYENAPCGYLSTRADGTIVRVNRTFEAWTGRRREDLVERVRFQDLLTPGGRIYHETHYAPLLQMQRAVSEIAVEIVRADGSRLPALLNSVVRDGADGTPSLIRTTVFDATDRRRYERELLRARRREQDIARELQDSLLSGELPSHPAFGIAVAYSPAEAGLAVGGDWYDGFWVGDETVALVVGDVVGRGIGAAATMGQLRSALRALASTGVGPGRVLELLDAYARRHGFGQMTTCVYAELHLPSRELRYACAGHPPPLMALPGEAPVMLSAGRSLPLDVFGLAAGPRPEGREQLEPGATVLLFTDGLIERRGEPITDGLESLAVALADRRAEPVTALVHALLEDLRDPELADDVCVLAVRLAESG
jgi:PAS domain S-box-containing protein